MNNRRKHPSEDFLITLNVLNNTISNNNNNNNNMKNEEDKHSVNPLIKYNTYIQVYQTHSS